MRPVIGITPDVGETSARPGRPPMPRYELKIAYADAVLAAGGLPIVLPHSEDETAPKQAAELCDGLVFTKLGPMKRGRTAYEQRALSVQWHPELLAGPEHLALYRALVDWAAK